MSNLVTAGSRLAIALVVFASSVAYSGCAKHDSSAPGASELKWSPLEIAMKNGDKKQFAALLAEKPDLSYIDAGGDTVVSQAAMTCDPDYLTMLLAHGANPNSQQALERTPLVRAIVNDCDDNLPLIQPLLRAGANPNESGEFGYTPLIEAALTNKYRAILLLLQSGANPRARVRTGSTFQGYLNLSNTKTMSADALRERALITDWLRQHNVPIEAAP